MLLGQPKGDGNPYTNTDKDWTWLQTTSSHARWLGCVDFDAITDERNAEPLTRHWSRPAPMPDAWVPEFANMVPSAQISDFTGSQLYHLALIGEKSSLESVLGPIADEYGLTCICQPETSPTRWFTRWRRPAPQTVDRCGIYFFRLRPVGLEHADGGRAQAAGIPGRLVP